MATPSFLLKLMLRPAIGRVKLRPEDKICIRFADALRAWTLEGRLNAVWCHVPNELGGGRGRASQVAYAIAKGLGVISGFADYVFVWEGGAGLIEFKAPNGRQAENQGYFEQWCLKTGVPYVIARSPEEGEAALREWGVLH